VMMVLDVGVATGVAESAMLGLGVAVAVTMVVAAILVVRLIVFGVGAGVGTEVGVEDVGVGGKPLVLILSDIFEVEEAPLVAVVMMKGGLISCTTALGFGVDSRENDADVDADTVAEVAIWCARSSETGVC
jgi:hypothetical protein